jgi:nitrate/nitrite transporter NarK
MFFLIAVIANFAQQQVSVLWMFHRLQYKIDPETYGWLMSAFGLGGFFSQLVLVPFLTLKLGVRDTALIMMAGTMNAISYLVEAHNSQIWVLFLSAMVLQLLWLNLGSATMSAISKIVEPTEMGKLMALLALITALETLAGQPFFAFVYQATLATAPAFTLYIAIVLFLTDVVLALYVHIRMKIGEKRASDVAVKLKE